MFDVFFNFKVTNNTSTLAHSVPLTFHLVVTVVSLHAQNLPCFYLCLCSTTCAALFFLAYGACKDQGDDAKLARGTMLIKAPDREDYLKCYR